MASDGDPPAPEAQQTAPAGPDPASEVGSGRARIGRWFGAIVIAAAVAAAVAFAVTAGVSDAVVVAHVAAAQELGPDRPLAASGAAVAGLRTPDLGAYRWAPIGARSDTIGTHTVATAFFQRGGRTVAASIVSGPPVRVPGPVVVRAGGVQVHRVSLAGRAILSWHLGGRTVVLSSVAVPEAWLESLARALATPVSGT